MSAPSDTPTCSRKLRGITIWPFRWSLMSAVFIVRSCFPKVSQTDFPSLLMPVA
jgi:hypothetical protein